MGIVYKMTKEAYKKLAYISYGKNKGKFLSKNKVLELVNDTYGLLGKVIKIEIY